MDGCCELGERYGRELGGSHLSGIDSLQAEHQPPKTASIFEMRDTTMYGALGEAGGGYGGLGMTGP